jgi:hypothetical protein
MPGASRNPDDLRRSLVDKSEELRKSVEEARTVVGGTGLMDAVILEKINERLSQAGFLVIQKPTKSSSGTDPWDR